MPEPAQAVVLFEPQSATGQSPGTIAAAASFRLVDISGDSLKVRFSCIEPFVFISVGYLIADMSGGGAAEGALAASLGGLSLAVS